MGAERKAVEQRRQRLRRMELRWSTLRLATFVATAAAGVTAVRAPTDSSSGPASARAGMALAAAACLAAFGYAVRRHGGYRTERELADRELLTLDEAALRAGGAVVTLRAADRPADPPAAAALSPVLAEGETWTLTEQERDDLDLYEKPVGVFGLLNRASSAVGARRLRQMLEHPCLEPDRIHARQECVRWLEEHADERRMLMAAAALLRGRDEGMDQFIAAVRMAREPAWWRQAGLIRAASVAGAVVILALLARGFAGSAGAAVWGTTLLLLNAGIVQRMRRNLEATLAPWRETSAAAAALLHVSRVAGEKLIAGGELAVLRNEFLAASRNEALPGLCRFLPWTESAGAMHGLLNALVYMDVHVAAAILGRVLPQREALLTAAAALGELEALASLACFAAEQPRRCYAGLSDEAKLVMRDASHPLIEPSRVVCNDLRLEGAMRTWIITGSNAAGKSTFLRTAGVNVLLAQMGAAACARSLELSPMRLMTDLRARDSLSAGESYFVAEVRHVRRMVSPPAGATPLLGLIDEPFRGTNSVERAAASVAVARHLIASGHFFLLATHDEQLTRVADGRRAANYHFAENLGAAGAVFDYRLRAGPATARNALRVMEREGYPAGLVAEARREAGLSAGPACSPGAACDDS